VTTLDKVAREVAAEASNRSQRGIDLGFEHAMRLPCARMLPRGGADTTSSRTDTAYPGMAHRSQVRQAGKSAVFLVTDTGPGIARTTSLESLSRSFAVRQHRRRDGFGLSIVSGSPSAWRK